MLSLRGLLFLSLLAQLHLYADTQTLNGAWHGGGKPIYTDGNEHYCLKPNAGTTAKFTLTNNDNGFRSCIYIALGQELGGKCKNDPTLEIEDLGEHMYKIVVAPRNSADGNEYTLDAEYDGTFGRCPDYNWSNFLGMNIEDVNFMLSIVGVICGVFLMGSVVYTILTIGNF